jgi:cell division protein DivIC
MEMPIIQKIFDKKYWIIMFFFVVWMIFFDSNSMITHWELSKELHSIVQEKEVLKAKINKEKREYNRLKNYLSEMEKLARERYFFKKPNEDVFVIETQKEKK